MSNLSLLFPFLNLCFTRPGEVLKNLYHFTEETRWKVHLQKKYGLPDGLPYVELLDFVPTLDETIRNYTYLEGTSRVTDMALLKALGRRFPNGDYFEFGTWRGESASNMADCMPRVAALSFGEKEMKEHHFPQEVIDVAFFFSKGRENITHIKTNSLTFDYTPHHGKYDLVFVDADHTYPSVKKDTESAFRLLKDENSILVWHDAGRGYEKVVNWQVQAGILDGAPSDDIRKKIYRVTNTLCAIYTGKALNAGFPRLYKPTKTFTVQITAKKL